MKLKYKEIPPPVKVEKEFTLTLNEQEAMVLFAVCNNVGGVPEGPRGIISEIRSNIMDKLDDDTIKTARNLVDRKYSPYYCGIYLVDRFC